MSRDKSLEPRFDTPTDVETWLLRARYPGAVEDLETDDDTSGTLSVSDDGVLVFESDVPSSAYYWDVIKQEWIQEP